MKKFIGLIIAGFILGGICFFLGIQFGQKRELKASIQKEEIKSIDEIKAELLQKEIEIISSFIDGEMEI